jgi:tyrosine aminotransferase
MNHPPPPHVNDITTTNMNTPAFAAVVVKSSPKKNNHNKCTMTSDTIPPPIWNTNHELQPQISSSSSSSLAFLSSSPTDVVLSSSSTLFQKQQQQQQPQRCLQPSSQPWPIFPMSKKAQRTHNPIRAILDPILQQSSNGCTNHNSNNCDKIQISLALGDPIAVTQTSSSTSTTTTTTLPLLPCPHAIRAVLSTLQSNDGTAAASYSNAIGTIEGRRAIATYHSHPPYYTYHPDNDIIIANGCSGALDILLTSLLDHPYPDGSNSYTRTTSILLVPSPGFPLYRVIAESNGAMVVSYPLLPNQQWEIDLIQLQNIMEQYQTPWYDESNSSRRNLNNTTTATTTTIRGIVINNPSNPTGAVYSTTHLQQIVHLCQQYHIPIIADEIYGDLIFPSSGDGGPIMDLDHTTTTHPTDSSSSPPPTFVSMAQIAAQMGRIVPVITASGIGKQFLLPGWRIGWICFQDKYVLFLYLC